MSWVVALLAGAILPGAFAPHHHWFLAILSPAILLGLWHPPTLSAKKAFLLGFFYGLGMFGAGVSWVFVSIHRYGNTDAPLAVLITLVFVGILALFIAAQGYILKRFFKGNGVSVALLGFPSSWVLCEWCRSWVLTGFPWLYLGYAGLYTPLSGYAPVASVFGVSLALALTSGSGFLIYRYARPIALQIMQKKQDNAATLQPHRTSTLFAVMTLISVWGLGQSLRLHSFTTLDPKPYTVSLVQGNIEPFDKFSQSDPIGATEKTYGRLTKEAWGSNLILWPESAIPLPLPYSTPYVEHLQEVAKHHNATLITGIQIINEKEEYHNSLITLGNGHGIYHKQHLVPFGDFLPLESWLRGLIQFFDLPMSSFVAGPKKQALLTAGNLTLAPLICYEIAFPEQVRAALQPNPASDLYKPLPPNQATALPSQRNRLRTADAIITLSEDGWFGNSWGPHQHLEIAQMRALETGRYVLRATTSGITAIINPKGNITKTAPQFQATTLTGSFYSAQGDTLWVKFGLWPLLALLCIAFVWPGRFF